MVTGLVAAFQATAAFPTAYVDNITLSPGDPFTIYATWDYRGPALCGRAADADCPADMPRIIGHQVGLLVETAIGDTVYSSQVYAWNEGGSADWSPRNRTREFTLPSDHAVGTFDVWVSIVNYDVTSRDVVILVEMLRAASMVVVGVAGVPEARSLAWRFQV